MKIKLLKNGKWHVTIKSSNDYINNFICNRLPFGLCYKSNKMTIIGMCAALNSFTWTCFILCAQIWRRIKGNLRRVGRGHGYMQPSTPHVLRSLRRWGGGDRSFQSQLWKLTEVFERCINDAFLLIGIISRPFIGYVGDTTYIELYIFYSQ